VLAADAGPNREAHAGSRPFLTGNDRQEGALKAWYVGDGDECGEIIYAATRGRARYIGASALDVEYAEAECRRAPQWDGLAPKGPTHEQLFNSGWRFLCNCGSGAVAGDGEADWIDGEAVCHDCVVARERAR
jgi:hypothetical protein